MNQVFHQWYFIVLCTLCNFSCDNVYIHVTHGWYIHYYGMGGWRVQTMRAKCGRWAASCVHNIIKWYLCYMYILYLFIAFYCNCVLAKGIVSFIHGILPFPVVEVMHSLLLTLWIVIFCTLPKVWISLIYHVLTYNYQNTNQCTNSISWKM
jgi:hypothetical protein